MDPEEARRARAELIRVVDNASNSVIAFGANVVRRNPIKVGFWVLGLLLGFFINGFEVSPEQMKQYDAAISQIPFDDLDRAYGNMYQSRARYERSRGWFWTCNSGECISNKARMDLDLAELNRLRVVEHELTKDAKASVGLLSEAGIAETRGLFWTKFDDGKAYASRKTKWDIIFAGLSAIGRDEKIGSFVFRIAFQFLINITMGLFGAVLAFWWNLWSLITEYRAGLLTGLAYFGAAGLAAGSFAMLWLVGIYSAAAGTMYVAAKVLSTNVRIEDGSRPRQHIQHEQQPY